MADVGTASTTTDNELRAYTAAMGLWMWSLLVLLIPLYGTMFPDVHHVLAALLLLIGALRLPRTNRFTLLACVAAAGALFFEALEAMVTGWNMFQPTAAAASWQWNATVANATGGGALYMLLFATIVLVARDALVAIGDTYDAERVARRVKPVAIIGACLTVLGAGMVTLGVERLDVLDWRLLPIIVPALAGFLYMLFLVLGSVSTARQSLLARRPRQNAAATTDGQTV